MACFASFRSGTCCTTDSFVASFRVLVRQFAAIMKIRGARGAALILVLLFTCEGSGASKRPKEFAESRAEKLGVADAGSQRQTELAPIHENAGAVAILRPVL